MLGPDVLFHLVNHYHLRHRSSVVVSETELKRQEQRRNLLVGMTDLPLVRFIL